MKSNNIKNSNNINGNIKRISNEITLQKRPMNNNNNDFSFYPKKTSSSDIISQLLQREKDILVLEKTISTLKEQNFSNIAKIDDLELKLNETQLSLNIMIENYNNIYNELISETKHNMQLLKENIELKQKLQSKL